MTKKVLISGASLAGPATALWLQRLGYQVTIVERAPALRSGGQAVDFKGRTHLKLLERMGIMDDVLAAQTPKTDLRIVDSDDRVRAVMPGEFLGGDIEILRGDLSRILFEHTRATTEYVFGDHITAMEESAQGVHVDFAHRASERFDLVIGADGVHSGVRRFAFGPEHSLVQNMGHYYAVVSGDVVTDLPTSLPTGRAVGYTYNEPGRMAVLGGQKAPQLFLFRADQPDYSRHDIASQKAFVARHYAGAGWRVPQMIEAMERADEFYLDALARTTMTSFTKGRVALVGDAGYANTLGGFGTGLALLGAYVLGGELARAAGDHRAAFAAYDRRMLGPTKIARTGNAGPFMAPPSRLRIWMRDQSFSNRALFGVMMWMTERFASDDTLPEYEMTPIDSTGDRAAGRGQGRPIKP